jgi:hypothetical protein
VSVFKKSAAALAAIAGLALTSSTFAADPFYSAPGTVVSKPAATTVTYRKVCTPTGCYLVPVTPTQPAKRATPAASTGGVPKGYRKVCTPTGCYLVPIEAEPAMPVKNYGKLFERNPVEPTAKPAIAKTSAPLESPFYSQQPSVPQTGKAVVNSRPVQPAVKKPMPKNVGGSLPSPFYP